LPFELSQLRCFVAAAEELHFGRAAARLNMTQPPLSRQIQLLERSVGVSLLERTSRRVRVTPAGRAFLIEARRILKLSESAAQKAWRISAGKAGSLAIGFTAASGYHFLPKLLRLMRSQMPTVDLALKEMVSGEQIEGLLTGRIDVGLLRPPIERRELATLRLLDEPLVAAIGSADSRARKTSLRLEDFDKKPFVMYSTDGARYFHDLVTVLLNRAQVNPINVQYMTQIHSILALVSSGLGAAIVPAAARTLHFEGVTFRVIKTTPSRPVELYLAWRKDSDNAVLGQFLELVQTAAAKAVLGTTGSDRLQDTNGT
jgi:DNA-binding transcriptional LysR family regulator